ncbi:MAG: M42 family metallopeptidase [Chloroflexota bacterium]|nr:M42 family metallopeptidase [Chloroflexota bacterium]
MILQELSEAFGVSGHESAVREIVLEAIQEDVDSYQVDALGNLIAFKRAHSQFAIRNPLKVMVSAHMDEVGIMVTHADKNGRLHFDVVGGLGARVLLAQPVVLGDDGLSGVIGLKPIHLQEKEERKKLPKVSDLTIDIGVAEKEEAEKAVSKGTYGAFATPFTELGGELRTVKGKAFDDRAGCAVLIELLKADYPFDLWAAFTVQEELGLRGARVAGFRVDPDVAFVLEGTVCDDLPKERDESPTTELGKGPAITIRDRSVVCDPRLIKHLVEVAKAEDIPYQFKQPGIGGTDAGAIHLVKEGVPSVVVSVPSRYIHSPVSLLSLVDFENTVRLMQAALSRLPESWT